MYVNPVVNYCMPRRTAADAEITRAHVLEAARRIATESGLERLTLDLAARESNVTRGAVYHHFGSKHGLCKALIVDELEQMRSAIERAAVPDDGEDSTPEGIRRALEAGSRAFLEAPQSRAYQRIVLVDGAAVLGPVEWRALDDEYTTSTLVDAFEAFATRAVGAHALFEPRAAAAAFSGAMNELSRWIADGNELEAAVAVVNQLLSTLTRAG